MFAGIRFLADQKILYFIVFRHPQLGDTSTAFSGRKKTTQRQGQLNSSS